jgi:DNA-binding transcriptional MerR regulator
MTYTINKIAKLAGVSVRTLHFYDEIGLLKPAYYGENNYRYYQESQLLLLQQILFYRELGLPLNEILRIVHSDAFDKIEALQSHKRILKKNLVQTQQLLQTIDKTLAYLRGINTMKFDELYYGFDSVKQKEHEKQLVEQGIVTQDFLDDCNQKIKNWDEPTKKMFVQDIERIMQALIAEIDQETLADAPAVQKLIHEHYVWLTRTWTPDKEKYLALIDLYQTPEFRIFYDERHPKLLDFMVVSMHIFAEQGFDQAKELESKMEA